MKKCRHIAPLLAAMFLVHAIGVTAAAQPYAAAPQQLAAAREQVRVAQADLRQQEQNAKSRLVSTDGEWARLQSACDAAQTRHEEIRRRLMDAYVQSPDYADAQAAIKKAERRTIEMTDARDTAQKEFEDAVNTAWEARSKLRMLQRIRVDEAPELKGAAADLRHATEVRDAYWHNYVTTTLSKTPAWVAASGRLESATKAVETAEAQVAEMRRQAAPNRPQRQYGGARSPGRRGSGMGGRRY